MLLAVLLAPGVCGAHAAESAPESAPEQWVLERAVLLQRHGVRAPTATPTTLARYSAEPWPSWPVRPGELTRGGRRALAVMAEYIRMRYERLGLLPRRGCSAPGELYVWADGKDQRTRVSGTVMAGGLAPGCGLAARHAAGRRDALFHPPARICRPDPQAAQAAVMARVNNDLNALGPQYERARRSLQAVLWPGVRDCAGSDPRCLIARGRNRLTVDHGRLKLTGPLEIGATLSENLLLEYADGLPSDQIGWGRAASPQRLQEILPLHVRYADLLRRTPEIAASEGTPLAHTMLRLLEQLPVSDAVHDAPPIPPSARIVILVGHDTNLSNVGAVLGLDWTLPGEPDSTAPDTTLALELWRNARDGHRYVRALVIYQTLAELRAEAMGSRVGVQGRVAHTLPLDFPGCTRSRCPLEVVRAGSESRMNRSCAREAGSG